MGAFTIPQPCLFTSESIWHQPYPTPPARRSASILLHARSGQQALAHRLSHPHLRRPVPRRRLDPSSGPLGVMNLDSGAPAEAPPTNVFLAESEDGRCAPFGAQPNIAYVTSVPHSHSMASAGPCPFQRPPQVSSIPRTLGSAAMSPAAILEWRLKLQLCPQLQMRVLYLIAGKDIGLC